ncbi:MAG: hypothetical protein JWL89_672 [Candidatus Saccharibacteria bacterium]|nr:hypothetical protein [Candidatus Saccharibacteria bacterium]
MPNQNNWYVVTGGPSTGKSALLTELEKLGHPVFPEAARTLIDRSLAEGISVQELRADEKAFQEKVAEMKRDTEAKIPAEQLTFFDRGMHDTLAYMRHYGYTIEDWVHQLMETSRYRKIFLLEPLPKYQQDYARTEDQSFIDNIQQLLRDSYREFGMEPITVPAASLDERVTFVLNHLKQEQPV